MILNIRAFFLDLLSNIVIFLPVLCAQVSECNVRPQMDPTLITFNSYTVYLINYLIILTKRVALL